VLVNTHLATRGGLYLSPQPLFLVLAEEELGPLGRDLNGDGDLEDEIVYRLL